MVAFMYICLTLVVRHILIRGKETYCNRKVMVLMLMFIRKLDTGWYLHLS